MKASSVSSPRAICSSLCSHCAVITGSLSTPGVMSMRDWPSGVETSDLPLGSMYFRPLSVSIMLARASVPSPSFSLSVALALASDTNLCMLAIASISEPSESLEGGVVFFLRVSTSAQVTGVSELTGGRDCSGSFFLASSSSSAATPVHPGSRISRPRASHVVSLMETTIFWAS